MNIELNDNEFIAIKVSQPFGDYFTVKLNAQYLLKRSYTKSANYDGTDISGAQRKIKRTRLNEIGQFIDSDEALFPNSIIIAANYNEKDILVEEDLRWKVEEIGPRCLPKNKYCNGDGDHPHVRHHTFTSHIRRSPFRRPRRGARQRT